MTNKEKALEIIEEWKKRSLDVYVVSDILKELKTMNPVDFYNTLNDYDDLKEKYMEVEESVNIFLEDIQKKVAFSNEKTNAKLLLTMIEANNKSKYWKISSKEKDNVESKSKEELSSELQNMLIELQNRDKLIR